MFVSLSLFHVCVCVCLKPIRSFRDCMSVCARRLQVAGIEIQLREWFVQLQRLWKGVFYNATTFPQ